MKVIGNMQIQVRNVRKQGIRITAEVCVTHIWSATEGNSDIFPLTITTELLNKWNFTAD